MTLTQNIKTIFTSVLFVCLFGGLSACASTSSSEGTGEYIDDSVITTKVKAMILHEPTLRSAEINVETFKGIVQLSGFISSRENMNKAIEVAKDVSGVKSVSNAMQLKKSTHE